MVPHCQRNYILVNALKTRKQLGLFFILQTDEDCCFPGFYFTHNIIQPALKPKFLFINPLKFPVAFRLDVVLRKSFTADFLDVPAQFRTWDQQRKTNALNPGELFFNLQVMGENTPFLAIDHVGCLK